MQINQGGEESVNCYIRKQSRLLHTPPLVIILHLRFSNGNGYHEVLINYILAEEISKRKKETREREKIFGRRNNIEKEEILPFLVFN